VTVGACEVSLREDISGSVSNKSHLVVDSVVLHEFDKGGGIDAAY